MKIYRRINADKHSRMKNVYKYFRTRNANQHLRTKICVEKECRQIFAEMKKMWYEDLRKELQDRNADKDMQTTKCETKICPGIFHHATLQCTKIFCHFFSRVHSTYHFFTVKCQGLWTDHNHFQESITRFDYGQVQMNACSNGSLGFSCMITHIFWVILKHEHQ